MSRREVWVTGIGCVSAAGPDSDGLLELLASGESAVTQTEGRSRARAPGTSRHGPHRHLGRAASMFMTAAEEAWLMAGLPADTANGPRAAVIEGSSLGPGPEMLATKRQRGRSDDGRSRRSRPRDVLRFMCGAGGSAFAQRHELEGGAVYLSAGSVSSAYAVAEAARQVAAGSLDLVVAGGGEAPFQEDIEDALQSAGILAPVGAPCRPFAPGRAGTVLGEGAAALLLEAADTASARGAYPLAVLEGWGQATEYYSMVAPDPTGTGVQRAVSQALADSGTAELGWIKVHGTGTIQGDGAEARGLSEAIGSELSTIPASGLKPALGHCLGASGAIEAVATILALRKGFVPATVGWAGADPALPALLLQDHIQVPRSPKALLLSESFGGKTVAIAVRAGVSN